MVTQKYDIIKNLAKYGAQRNAPVVRAVRRINIASFGYWYNSASLKSVREHAMHSYQREQKSNISQTLIPRVNDLVT